MKPGKLLGIILWLCFVSFASTAEPINQSRIVSLIPSQTELLFELGFGKDIVGVSDYCNFPEESASRNKVGGMELNIEKIMSLKPTLILDLNSMHKRYELLFRQLGLNYVDLRIEKLADIPLAATEVSSILSAPKNSASFVRKWDEEMAKIALNRPEVSPRVYLEIWDTPMQAAGPLSFMGQMIEIASGENIITNQTDYPVVNSEHIISANPEIILIAYPLPNLEAIKARPGWSNISAVKTGKIFSLNQDLFVRPGPRNLEGLKILLDIFSGK